MFSAGLETNMEFPGPLMSAVEFRSAAHLLKFDEKPREELHEAFIRTVHAFGFTCASGRQPIAAGLESPQGDF
jgi:hypothetical protein